MFDGGTYGMRVLRVRARAPGSAAAASFLARSSYERYLFVLSHIGQYTSTNRGRSCACRISETAVETQTDPPADKPPGLKPFNSLMHPTHPLPAE